MGRQCPRCKQSEPAVTFAPVGPICRACKRIDNARRTPAQFRQQTKQYRQGLRAEMIAAYGGKCQCDRCNESNPRFLSIDHIHGGGAQHRRAAGGGASALRQMKREGWPRDKYRLLCYNCNQGRAHNTKCPGVCPHHPCPERS